MCLEKRMTSAFDHGYRMELHGSELLFWIYDDDGDDWLRAVVEPRDTDYVILDLHGFNWHSCDPERVVDLDTVEPAVLSKLQDVARRMLGADLVPVQGPQKKTIDRDRWDVERTGLRSSAAVSAWWFQDGSVAFIPRDPQRCRS